MACAGAPEVVTDFDRSHDFSTVRTIAILPLDRTSPAQVVISPAQADRIERVLRAELARRDLEVVRDKTVADMFLSWDMVVREGVGTPGVDAGTGAPCGHCKTDYPDSEDLRHTAGTLILDMIDPVQLRSVWRATVRPPSQTAAGAGLELESGALRQVVRAALAKFPPRVGDDA